MHLLNNVIVGLILLSGAIVSARLKKLTIPAAATGVLAGWLVFAGGGYTGLGMLAAFFILGTVATSWGKRQKGSSVQSTRTAGQVFANGGVAALAGAAAVVFPVYHSVFELAMAASLASATADTLSSELGMVYGRRYYNILTWRPDQRGLDGVVSLEGTLIGVAGSAFIALLYAIPHGWHGQAWIIILAGTAGNLTDSLLGALLERKGLMGNDMVNFLNTLAAAIIAGLIPG